MNHAGAVLTVAGLGVLTWHLGPLAFGLYLIGVVLVVWRS